VFSGSFLLLGLLKIDLVYSIDQGYIDAIEADVAEFTIHEFHPPADSEWLGNTADESAQLMDLDSFAAFLKSKSPGSFIFYEKLPMEYKNQLHNDYLVTGDLDRIKQDIFKYTGEVNHEHYTQ
jgi:hypothetical protein